MAYRVNHSNRISVDYYEFLNNYKIDSLQSNARIVQSNIENLKKIIEDSQQYLADVYEHSVMVITAPKKPYIIAYRNGGWSWYEVARYS